MAKEQLARVNGKAATAENGTCEPEQTPAVVATCSHDAQASSLTEASRVEMLPAFADLGRRGATCLCGKASNSGMVSGLPGQTYVF